VRLGFGPSGEAASERRTIEVPDVFAGRRSRGLAGSRVGARLSRADRAPACHGRARARRGHLLFADAESFSPEKRGLLRIVADQMAATAEKALLIDELRRSNAALVEANAELERSTPRCCKRDGEG
jgi:hypothetical protein